MTPAPISPTVTPLSSPSPMPTIKPNPTTVANPSAEANQAAETDDTEGTAQGGAISGLKVDDLPRRNGIPRLPVVNSSPGVTTSAPLKANYGSQGQPRVGVQAGHWQSAALPDELASLRTQTGGSGGGVREVDFNVEIARKVVKLLQDNGVEADLLNTTVPINYAADAFVAIHADAVNGGGPGGYKLARGRNSAIPATDDALMNTIYDTYGKATGFRRDSNITRNMTGYYAFSNRRRQHAITKATPAVIVETGYLTHPPDLAFLTSHQDIVAQGIADGILKFLNSRPPLELREKPADTMPGAEVTHDDTLVLSQPNGPPLALVSKGQQFEYYDIRGDYYVVWVPVLNKTGFLQRADAKPIRLPR